MDTRSTGGYDPQQWITTLRKHALKTKHDSANPIAYSYLRFSSPAQAEGDSVRRQTTLRDAWLKRNPSVNLDKSLLIDQGVSGFTGANRKNQKHALAQFLDLVERGRVPVGSYLIVENLDRLTRETPVDAIPAVLGLIKAGVRVVQLAPSEMEYHAEMDQGALMMMLWELSRGNSESKRKSGMCGEAWKEKKEAARASHAPYGKMCPAWLELDGDKYRVKTDAATAVRRVFQLCADGVGTFGILAKLNEEGVKPIGRGDKWERSYVKKLLNSVSVLGTYQPMKGRKVRVAEGEPIAGYYPAIIPEQLWHKAHEAMKNRTKRTGRPAVKSNNPFSGLLRCALDDCPLHVSGTNGSDHKYLVSANSLQKVKGAAWVAFPLDVFRTAILNELAELKAADLFADPGAERLVELTNQLADVERRLASATARFEADPESQQWQNLVSKYDREKRATVKELADERQRSANPLSSSWVEAVELMASDEPERLRQAILSVVDGVRCVFVANRGAKLAGVQVCFRGGGQRSYLIHYQPQRGSHATGKPTSTSTKTFAEAGLPESLDLCTRADAAQVAKWLTKTLARLRR